MLKKNNIFRVILILIPFIILILVEAILRLTGYGPDLNIVAKIKRDGKDYYTMNQLVGNRYFREERLFFRKGSHDFFEVNKSPNTIRVFCFGASTMAGFPYEYNAIPSEFLRDRLVNALSGKNIEVINTAIAATNSYTVTEFVKELSHYKPDLFIVYMGQNEFYGAFGVGSSISIGKSRWLIKTYLWLQQFKTFLLLKNIVYSISNYFKPSQESENKILMEQMVKNNSIKYNGSDFITAENSFKDNYEEIIETAKENKIPVIISTLVTNEEQAPFVSMYSDNLSDSLKNKFNEYLNSGINYRKSGDYADALKSFEKSAAIDSLPANIHYQIGLCDELNSNYIEAKKQFIHAKDLDGLRFRAPSVFNQIIRKLSRQYNEPLSDVNKSFHEESPHGIIGNELLIDHVHPNIKGYFLLAKTWFRTIKDNDLIGISSNVTESDSLLWQQSSVTPLDSLIGELKIMKLKSRPPFSSKDSEFVYTPHNSLEQIAYNYLTGNNRLSWGMAHVTAAKEYLVKKDLEKVLKEYKAILITDETNPNLLSIIGDIYYQMKLYQKAESSYSRAFYFDNNQFLKYRLGLTSINLKKPELAIQYFNSCLLDNNNSTEKFSYNQIDDIRYNLALAYYQTNQNEKALGELNIILKNNPTNADALQLFKKIK